MKRPEQPLVSIVIVNWNGLDDTKICIEHTRKQTYENVEIIVVDNGSTDDSLDFLSKLNDIKLVQNKTNRGFTGGHIAGFTASAGDYILLLNNDAVMDYNYIDMAVAHFKTDETIGVLGGRAYLWNQENELFDTENKYYGYQNINPISAEGIFVQKDEGVPREVNNVSGSSVLIKRSTIEKVGYLEDSFFAYYEESDLFARVKRAGYKVIYHPGLAIWHANGKSSNRRGSGFAYYMMMRNRFKFAVRNFDTWSLIRFLKYYVKMGIHSTSRAVLAPKNHPIEKEYSKAFFYNLTHIIKPFSDRRKLQKQLGVSKNYSQLIFTEQIGISYVISCKSTKDIDNALQFAARLWALDEVIVCVADNKVTEYARKYMSINSSPLRLCIDRHYFSAPTINLGISCAKNEWICIGLSPSSLIQDYGALRGQLYAARCNAKAMISLSITDLPDTDSVQQVCTTQFKTSVLLKKSLFVASGGLSSKTSTLDSVMGLIIYGSLSKSLMAATADSNDSPTTSLSSNGTGALLTSSAAELLHDSQHAAQKATRLDLYLERHYHSKQLANYVRWLLSSKVKSRLKVARTLNLLKSCFKLDRRGFALELKHIRNEVFRTRYLVVDMKARKLLEKKRLQHFIAHPEESTVFIICRDRYKTLRELLDWLEAQSINKIVLIDNDSALPELVEYLENTKYQVLEQQSNIGHTVAWSNGIIRTLVPSDFYILTDPDVIPTQSSLDVVKHLYELHEKFPDHLKIGLGLKIDDLPDTYELKKEVISWEGQFWQHEYAPGVFEAGVDTTFAVYKPYTHNYFIHPSLRSAEPYTARHLPWYANSNGLSEEEIFYRIRADQNINTWDKGKLPERYVAELAKQNH